MYSRYGDCPPDSRVSSFGDLRFNGYVLLGAAAACRVLLRLPVPELSEDEFEDVLLEFELLFTACPLTKPCKIRKIFGTGIFQTKNFLIHPNDPRPVHPRFRSLDAPVCASWDHL